MLAFSWGLYFVVLTAVGFDLGLTLSFLVITAVVIVIFAGVELLARKRRPRQGGALQV